MKKKDIYLIRHGETEWNTCGRFQGKLDSPLTAQGQFQAEAFGAKISQMNLDVDSFISSPLGRTIQTASIISGRVNLPPLNLDERLAEVSLGSWDGLTHVDIDAQWPRALDGSTQFDWYFRSCDGESYDTALDRANQWLNETHGVIVAVSHGLIGRIIRGAYLKLSKEETLTLPVPQNMIWRLHDNKIIPLYAG